MSKPITIKQAREYYDLGIITNFHLVRDPLHAGGWMIHIEGKSGASWTLQTARGDVRSFATLDAAARVIEETGMRISSLAVGV